MPKYIRQFFISRSLWRLYHMASYFKTF